MRPLGCFAASLLAMTIHSGSAVADRAAFPLDPLSLYFGGVGAGVGWTPDCFSSCSRC